MTNTEAISRIYKNAEKTPESQAALVFLCEDIIENDVSEWVHMSLSDLLEPFLIHSKEASELHLRQLDKLERHICQSAYASVHSVIGAMLMYIKSYEEIKSEY